MLILSLVPYINPYLDIMPVTFFLLLIFILCLSLILNFKPDHVYLNHTSNAIPDIEFMYDFMSSLMPYFFSYNAYIYIYIYIFMSLVLSLFISFIVF